MYSFQANAGRRRNKQTRRLLYVIIFILAVALAGVSFAYYRNTEMTKATSEALINRALSESAAAQNAVYRLTQSSGTNMTLLLATVRSHVYAMESLNQLPANIYGPTTTLVDADLLAACSATLDECDERIQAGSVVTEQTSRLRDNIDALVASLSHLH